MMDRKDATVRFQEEKFTKFSGRVHMLHASLIKFKYKNSRMTMQKDRMRQTLYSVVVF